ncbi:HAD-like domain-containing protein [Kickxella alabastrina]|uniref:HAD-like domain-containing protein n=1 Tax=Kickxella alabastrina TaxID=61397 RepID=UPI00221EEF32|nr:HAD-like domain-containing protein [Kickxella alabastrina]KAI7831903.1 HAD-like domain-containing protein [Kickxella alabastrina]
MAPQKLSTLTDYQTLVDKYDTFLFDCDGVIWRGSTAIVNVQATLSMLRNRGKRLIFVTNNSGTSRKDYVTKFAKLGIQASLCLATAVYLSEVARFPSNKKAYVIGGSAFVEPNPDVAAVVFGIDYDITYRKLANAHLNLTLNPGCLFIATNDDRTLPGGKHTLIHSTQRSPLVMGKPNTPMLDSRPHRSCMVGDRLDTDILFGIKGGLSTLCVLTGVADEAAVLDPVAPQATYYISSLGDLCDLAAN